MKLELAHREFISAVANPERGSLDLRYQVIAYDNTIRFDQELQVTVHSDGRATAYMQIEDVPTKENSEAAVQRLADHLEMMAKALRATNPNKRTVKTRGIPVFLHGSSHLIHKPRR